MDQIRKMLNEGTPSQIKALFLFDRNTDSDVVLWKYRIWSRWFFPKLFKSDDASFHEDIDRNNLETYLNGGQYLDIAFRGAAKTARTKLFVAFVIANDESHYRKSFKVLSEDISNAEQNVTDVYNMLVAKRVRVIWPEVFEKTDAKRQESMKVFTTSTGVKIESDSILTSQRGDQQGEEASRPDFIWFDDFETKKSLLSAIATHKIWLNMDEAYQGLEKGGGAIYNCNYLSERGNVHKLVLKVERKTIVPIEINGIPTWPARYSVPDLKQIRKDAEDYEGDYLCLPSSSRDIYFDRDRLNAMTACQPIKEVGDFKIYKEYNPTHRYAGGHDVAGGVGLDHSTSVFLDFDTIPARIVGTYKSNTILPEAFGMAAYEQGNKFGGCLLAIENNKYDQAVLKAKQMGADLYKTQGKPTKINFTPPATYGWGTNALTKNQMLAALAKAIEDGLIDLVDPEVIAECKAYSRNDLIDTSPDVRLTTNHFDFVMALAIAWQMKDFAKAKEVVAIEDPIWAKKEENIAI
jgi:hypothetical protein